jgi:hypothetical protein
MNRKREYIVISKHLLQRSELKRMMKCQNRAELFGIYMMAVLHLSKAEKAIGDEDDIELIHRQCGKYTKAVRDVINHYGLFDIDEDGRRFQCRMLQKTLRIETTLGMDADEESDNNAGNRPEENPKRTQTTVKQKLKKNDHSATLSVPARDHSDSYSHHHTTDHDETSSSSSVREADGGDGDVFSTFVDEIFNDMVWLETVENIRKLNVYSDRNVREIAKVVFKNAIIANGHIPYSREFTAGNGRRYFLNYTRQGLTTRMDLDRRIEELLHPKGEGPTAQNLEADDIPDIAKDRIHVPNPAYENIDQNGKRWGPHGEEVDFYALPCLSDEYIYDMKRHKWVYYDD